MNSRGLRRKLLFSHIGVSLGSLLTIMLLVYFAMSFSFGKYVQHQYEAEANTILEDLKGSYNVNSGQWRMNNLMSISHQAMLRNYDIRIYDAAGNIIWDTENMGRMMHGSASKGMHGKVSESEADHVVTRDIIKNGEKIGSLEIIGIAGSFETQNRQFLKLFNTLLGWALVAVIAGVTVFSILMSNSLSRPLVRIRQIAAQMKEGNLSSRVPISSRQTEIEEVGLALNHLADSLQQQDKLRKHLTADIAHELRTPLTTIQSHIEAFQDGIWEVSSEKLEICHEQVMRLVKLIQDLESLTRVENPMVKLQRERLCLNEIIKISVNSIKGQFEGKPIELVIKEQDKLYISGDAGRLTQVFANLLENAYKYTNEGQISIEMLENSDQALVMITDTGPGIEAEELPYIFERFYRGDKSRNRKTGGAGIGLAIVKAIVEAHGGSISIKSKPGEGTRFDICFPK
ncbi:sensor histidine kinase [Paenibacillus bouchesdurhonensis]|uniref:sensor histidine kinase n=1 Tax=Paenibacillus bouchesdurhonensis TaxID=1870990 RepID=UPI000DA6015C|nr:HAMP domain-containing sensor histidine kinase [Paenibacillus bouchesdurhonensis]